MSRPWIGGRGIALGVAAAVLLSGGCATNAAKESEEQAVPRPEWRVGDRWIFKRTLLAGTTAVVTHQVIGGEMFHTLTAGPRLGRAGRLHIHTLYYDAAAPKGTGQFFASFDVRRGER